MIAIKHIEISKSHDSSLAGRGKINNDPFLRTLGTQLKRRNRLNHQIRLDHWRLGHKFRSVNRES